MVFANEAVEKGMIDGMLDADETTTQSATGGKTKTEAQIMDLNELKTKHPALYAEVHGAGCTQAVKAEQERVEAHLLLAEGSGDMETALASIKSGDGITELVKAKHLSASMKASAASARKGDEEVLDTGDASTTLVKQTASIEDQTFEAYAELMTSKGEFY